MSSCPIDISHSGTILNPLSLFTLLTSLTNHTHVHPLLFHNDEHEFEISFHPSLTVFTPNELENITKYPNSFCHFQGANRMGFRAWLSVCDKDEMEMILHTPLMGFSLSYSNETFQLVSNADESCDILWKSSRKRGIVSVVIVSKEPLPPYSLPKYYKEYSHLFERKRIIELAMFGDQSLWIKYGKSEDKAKRRMRKLIHMAISYFASLRIEIQLVHIEVHASRDVLNIDFSGKGTVEGSFQKFLKKFKGATFDHAMLLTRYSGHDGAGGLALPAKMCYPQETANSNSWIWDQHSFIECAKSIAHELGHSLGILHDIQDGSSFAVCECPVKNCFLARSVDLVKQAQYWSNCSLGYLEKLYENGADYCLWNDPLNRIDQSYKQDPFFHFCGNGIIEDGEECDCGLDGCITHDCCDSNTCKLRDKAQCSSGLCCDLSTCSILRNISQICRAAKTSCDHTEYCDGKSTQCPEDKFYEDGETCPEDKNAICYKGRCGSRVLQCKAIWGENTKPGGESCYHRNSDCGVGKNCDPQNELCGVLHCNPGHSGYTNLYGWHFDHINRDKSCRSGLAGYKKDYVPDYHLGMTPDGASCGSGKFCMKSKCVSKAEILGCNFHHFYNSANCHNAKGCAKPKEKGKAIQCDDGFGLQAELNDKSWIDVSTVTCVDNKYEIVSEKGEKINVNAIGFRCLRLECTYCQNPCPNCPEKSNAVFKPSSKWNECAVFNCSKLIINGLIVDSALECIKIENNISTWKISNGTIIKMNRVICEEVGSSDNENISTTTEENTNLYVNNSTTTEETTTEYVNNSTTSDVNKNDKEDKYAAKGGMSAGVYTAIFLIPLILIVIIIIVVFRVTGKGWVHKIILDKIRGKKRNESALSISSKITKRTSSRKAESVVSTKESGKDTEIEANKKGSNRLSGLKISKKKQTKK